MLYLQHGLGNTSTEWVQRARAPIIADNLIADGKMLPMTIVFPAGGPLKRFALKRLIGDRDARGIIRLLRERYQAKDVLVQQQQVARAEALAFIATVFLSLFCRRNGLSLRLAQTPWM